MRYLTNTCKKKSSSEDTLWINISFNIKAEMKIDLNKTTTAWGITLIMCGVELHLNDHVGSFRSIAFLVFLIIQSYDALSFLMK